MATAYTHSIPTPPFSPHNYRMPDETTENPLRSTINLLDSLVAFYQHERMWVYRTRAMLEEAFQMPPLPGTAHQQYLTDQHGMPMDIRMEDMNDPGAAQSHQSTRWMRRKRGFKLRLDGIRNRRVISTQPVGQGQGQEQGYEELQPRERILEMFDKMMESRMESCQRVTKLVRDANRANLHDR
ncbi:hypothetical protein NLJ89_g151 [Agrocybe chaxingu]|uniref:Uncharacterized protein n=1 Tax=Agrocybe chaxingu TaxID=84603 RepID=A0A9W8N2I5_9AGAR|nr:hypothetical protein NLJ89_g151 [Agrocybe chaxingu]